MVLEIVRTGDLPVDVADSTTQIDTERAQLLVGIPTLRQIKILASARPVNLLNALRIGRGRQRSLCIRRHRLPARSQR